MAPVRRLEILAATVLVVLSGAAVWSQLAPTDDETPPVPRPLEVGEALSPDVGLLDLDGRSVRLGDRLGERATVLYSWSTTCPCVPICEDTLQSVQARFPAEAGVAWLAVCGEPRDAPGAIRALLGDLDATYTALLDPAHRLCARAGLDRAALLVVLDGDGYVRFRGNLTDDLESPTTNHLAAVLPAIVAGDLPPYAEPEIAYGCAFSAPLEDCPDAELLEALEASAR